MKLLNFTIIKLTFCLIIGIIIGFNFNIELHFSFLISITLLAILGLSIFLSKKNYKQDFWIGFLIFTTTISVGVLTINVNNQLNFKSHYSNQKTISIDTTYTINFRIREILKPSLYHNKYVIDVLKINNETVLGKSLLNVEKDSTKANLNVDDILITSTNFQTINAPLNPHQFDYKSYLQKKHIYNQLYIANPQLLKISTKKHTLFGYASQLRERININLKQSNFKEDELAIINALLLGQRQDISKDIYDSYSQAGVIHILAVSGLHVGIILLLLNFMFKPIERIKHGKTIKILLIVVLLWSFAIIAGLSASVTRAVTMFSIVAIGINLKRPTNIFNTLAISMFVILLFKPLFLLDVGFQLSYLAVFAIVTIQPILYKLWKPKLKIIDYFWQIFTVTLAAQFGVIPVSLYYFHQFPGLFFVSNLVIIPFLGFILGFGIFIIILALLNILPSLLANLYGSIISLMNDFVSWISQQEQFLFKNISFGILEVIVSYIFIVTIVNLYKKRNYKNVVLFLISIVGIQSTFLYNKYQATTNELIVFNKSRFSIIGIKQKNQLLIHHNLDSSSIDKNSTVTNYKIGERIAETKADSIQSIYTFNNKNLLVVDSLGIYNVKSFIPNIVLLRNSPKINLKRLINTLQPELIISDGSNYKSYQERWSKTCEAQKIPFHQTSKKGAYVYRY
ncbi:MAG: competence protein ComEC family protein [Flavobacteriaceae bacterium]|nr:competence protein ComEC family protein [Flavobacteriaceae bacterium]